MPDGKSRQDNFETARRLLMTPSGMNDGQELLEKTHDVSRTRHGRTHHSLPIWHRASLTLECVVTSCSLRLHRFSAARNHAFLSESPDSGQAATGSYDSSCTFEED